MFNSHKISDDIKEQILDILKTGEKSLAKIASLISPPLDKNQVIGPLYSLRQSDQVQCINYDDSYPLMYRRI